MRNLEKGDDKVEKICSLLRRETLEPAQREAKDVVANAEAERDRILADAESQAKQLMGKARTQIEQEQSLFQTSLQQAGKQAIELLKQRIQQSLFNPALEKFVEQGSRDPALMAQLITALVKALDRDGLSVDVAAVVAKGISVEEVNRQLAKNILESLKDHTVTVGDFAGGVKVKLQAKKMTLDISDEALKDVLATFLRDQFRTTLFGL